MENQTRKAYPGMLLGSCAEVKAAEGTYTYLGKVYASQSGFIKQSRDYEAIEGDPQFNMSVVKTLDSISDDRSDQM